MKAKSLAACLGVAARDFGSLLSSAKTRPVSHLLENSIPMMADLYRGAGVGSLQGLEALVKANFYEAQVRKDFSEYVFLFSLLRQGRDAWEGLLDVQASWDDFLTKVTS